MTALRRYLWLSQASFCVLLTICALVWPRVATSEGGVSNFANRWPTLPLYVLAFALCVFYLARAASVLVRLSPALRLEAAALRLVAALDLLVLASTFPRRIAWSYSVVHDDLGIALFAFEFVVGIWLVRAVPRSRLVEVAFSFAAQLVGEVLALLTVLKLLHLLFWAQTVETVGFAVLLIAAVPAVARRRLDRS